MLGPMENYRWAAENDSFKVAKEALVIQRLDRHHSHHHDYRPEQERRPCLETQSSSSSLCIPQRRCSNDGATPLMKQANQLNANSLFELEGDSSTCTETRSGSGPLTTNTTSTSNRCGSTSSSSTLVRFQDEVEIFWDESKWTQEEIEATWYSKGEYQEIHGELDDTAALIVAGLMEDPERGGHCLRGLEYKTQDAKDRRRKNIWKSQRAVLRIQDQFHRLRICDEKLSQFVASKNGETDSASSASTGSNASLSDDDEDEFLSREDESLVIASAYRKYSFPCQMEAHNIGLWDAKVASRLWNEDKCPKPPRRTWAKAG